MARMLQPLTANRACTLLSGSHEPTACAVQAQARSADDPLLCVLPQTAMEKRGYP